MQVVREYNYPSLSKTNLAIVTQKYDLLALSKAIVVPLNSNPDKLLRFVISTKMPKILELLRTKLLDKIYSGPPRPC